MAKSVTCPNGHELSPDETEKYELVLHGCMLLLHGRQPSLPVYVCPKCGVVFTDIECLT